MEVAEALGEDPDMVFKTLVTVGKSKANYVFVVPVNRELNLKKSGAERRGEERRNDQVKRTASSDRVYSWRLLAHRDEEAVSDCY